jgi:UDP-2,3-diacylglucosamine pyrophosphatase LpxH
MRIAVISDTHFGDRMCALVTHDTLAPGKAYKKFVEKAGQNNDYLVLLGDIIDFSIASYADAYKVAKAFFHMIKQDNIAKSIIYVPGNHDFEMWHTVECQINIIRQVREGRPPRRFHWSVPGLIEDRDKRKNKGFQLPGVTEVVDPEKVEGEKIFLNYITRTKPEDDPSKETNFYFAYPNLYLVTDKESVLMTHGHYLEAYWSMVGEWVMKIGQEDLRIGDALDLRELVAMNFPSCQLACSGIGQAGPLTDVVRQVQRQVKDQQLDRVETYLDRLDDEIDKLTPFRRLDLRELGSDVVCNYLKKKALGALKKFKDTRYSEEFAHKKEVLARFRRFYEASWAEICELNENHQLDIPQPYKVIFGHTHRPLEWGAAEPPRAKINGCKPVKLYNTGGWLWQQPKGEKRTFCGAAVFVYDSKEGFASHVIEQKDLGHT